MLISFCVFSDVIWIKNHILDTVIVHMYDWGCKSQFVDLFPAGSSVKELNWLAF